ncbi:ornithine carbamoyltransferase [Calycomorphotria hydatis]|uniref:Ornithine carbamoyltransferase n=1 Tax=Calycomorphotria hydatis TaxID=2528027 RepID=A0A517T838_9PLAN|nr:ornithine carbamoyltransferase [Calycomorphotria hydatis]QDT64538.1 Ornithine carbamoyltransferase [Calycomorphotria hydatis]
MRHLLNLFDWSSDDITEVLTLAADLKSQHQLGIRKPILERKVLAQVYDKPSLRTRVSFEAAMMQLGGSCIFMTSKEAGWTGRESLPDVSKVLSSFSDAIVIRTFSQELVDEVASYSSCPVINGLTDEFHPAQALTDLMTVKEAFGIFDDRHLVFVGDGNNVARSLAIACGRVGMRMTLCGPSDYHFEKGIVTELKTKVPGLDLTVTDDLHDAVKDANVIYTDVWASMGQEKEQAERKKVFEPYQVNGSVMKEAPKNCKFLHCLPAHRGEEVTDEVMDAPYSLAFEQAENRMHLAKGLLAMLLT